MQITGTPSKYGLEHHGLHNLRTVYWNLYPPELVEQIIHREEGILARMGAVAVNTGQHTGRSPSDKFIVRYDEQNPEIWWGKVNQPISPQAFDRLYNKMLAYLQGRDIFVQDLLAGADPQYQVPIRVISEKAWASLFSNNLFIRLPAEKMADHIPDYLVVHCPDFHALPKEDGTNSSTFILVDFARRIVLLGGTSYAGEIKKSIFSVMNYVSPQRGVLSMHCSANVGVQGDVALFFGLSGTGKTTLSSSSDRQLIGDDEHGWSDQGIFNFEGGCYAKTIHLQEALEPLIWEATRQFGTVLENVVIDPITRVVDFESNRFTENTRAAYPLDFVPNHVVCGAAGHPDNIFLLTADAFGVLPPLASLTPEQAMYYFLSGYTSKIAGTEKGLGTEPLATFSTCFGAPFLPLKPQIYADLLKQKIAAHHVKVWLLNTGWTGGPYGTGQRIRLPYTRAMVEAVLSHQLDAVVMHPDPYFGLLIPDHCPGVPDEILQPELTWTDKNAYRILANNLKARFHENFEQFGIDMPTNIQYAGLDDA